MKAGTAPSCINSNVASLRHWNARWHCWNESPEYLAWQASMSVLSDATCRHDFAGANG
jgi:hypothetical protein